MSVVPFGPGWVVPSGATSYCTPKRVTTHGVDASTLLTLVENFVSNPAVIITAMTATDIFL
jgi:hypothetical protein